MIISQKVSKAQVVAVLTHCAKRVGLGAVLSEDVIRKEFSSDLKTAGAVLAYIPLPNGVKLVARKVGCVQTFSLTATSQSHIDALLVLCA